MLHHIRAEWLKLSKRPMMWILLSVWLVLLIVQFLMFLMIAVIGEGIIHPAQVTEMTKRLAFPGIFGATFGHVNSLGGIFAVILTAGMMGSEYGWGTLRTELSRHPARVRYIVAKLIMILLTLLVAILITLVFGIVVGWLVGLVLGGAGVPSVASILQIPMAIVRALYVLLPYVLLTFCMTIFGRSLLVGLAVGLTFLIIDISFGSLATFAELGGVWQALYNLTLQQNITPFIDMNSRVFGLTPELVTGIVLTDMPSMVQATLIVGTYCISFIATTIYFFTKRDITGPN
ncbi:MAG: ABC transporter permease [Chloroflexota bacterium]